MIDFEQEIREILMLGIPRMYSKKILDGKQRIEFSVLAHLHGLVSNSVSENNVSFLSISPPLNANETIDDERLFGFFSNLVSRHVSSTDDVKFYGLESDFSLYMKNIEKNSFSGYKRYYEIMQQWLFTVIIKLENFKQTEHVVELVREKASKKPGNVFLPQNDGLFCVSVDVKSSIFQGYKELGVFKQSWEEFIALHTKDELFIRSKNLRLNVFGRCNIFRKNQIIINNTITPFWNRIVDTIESAVDSLIFLSGDECVFGFKTMEQATTMQKGLEALQFPPHIVVTVYRLEQKTLEEKTYFLRHFFTSKKIDIKGAAPQILKKATEMLRQS